MTKVKIAEFRSHLSEYLRQVRLGHGVVITDGENPIARVVPYRTTGEELIVRPSTRPRGRTFASYLASRPRN